MKEFPLLHEATLEQRWKALFSRMDDMQDQGKMMLTTTACKLQYIIDVDDDDESAQTITSCNLCIVYTMFLILSCNNNNMQVKCVLCNLVKRCGMCHRFIFILYSCVFSKKFVVILMFYDKM